MQLPKEHFTLLAVHTAHGVSRALYRADMQGRFREYVTYSSEGPEHTHVFRNILDGLDEVQAPLGHESWLRGLAIATDNVAAQPHLEYFRDNLNEIQGKFNIERGRA